jgi:hypothetical protein
MTAMPAYGLGRLLLVATGVVVAATIAAAIMVMGAPDTQRQLRLDERRVQELQRLSEAIDTHAYRHGALPQTLSEITGRPGAAYATTDPVTGVPYRYELDGPDDYRLCSEFDTDTARAGSRARPYGGDTWAHPAGEHCFARKVDERAGRQ